MPSLLRGPSTGDQDKKAEAAAEAVCSTEEPFFFFFGLGFRSRTGPTRENYRATSLTCVKGEKGSRKEWGRRRAGKTEMRRFEPHTSTTSRSTE